MAELTYDELNKMTMAQIAKHFGVKRPKPGMTKRDFIEQCVAATTQPVEIAEGGPVTLDGETKTVKLGKVDVVKQGRFLPAIVIRTPDGLDARWTPLGDGRWREEFSAATGHLAREGEGGVDALWDGTTIVLTYMTDNWNAPVPYDPIAVPFEEETDGATN